MGTYFDKKKLLEENDDLYISQYDKNLDIQSLSKIIDAKRKYKTAQQQGDKDGEKKANDTANAVRKAAARYDGGEDGSEYNASYKDYEINRPSSYKSGYRDKIEKNTDKITESKEFSYDPEEDPLFHSYRQIYHMLGNDAYERALAENSFRTGGMVSTGAQSAAMLAKNEYNSMLASKIPELYKLAYGKYLDDRKNAYDSLDALSELDENDYSRYRDNVDDFENDREYFYKSDKDYSDRMDDIYKYNTDLEYDLMEDAMEQEWHDDEMELENNEFAYRKERDNVKDSQWNSEFNNNKLNEFNKLYISKLNAAVNLAKALYGKVPVSSSVINSILAMLE